VAVILQVQAFGGRVSADSDSMEGISTVLAERMVRCLRGRPGYVTLERLFSAIVVHEHSQEPEHRSGYPSKCNLYHICRVTDYTHSPQDENMSRTKLDSTTLITRRTFCTQTLHSTVDRYLLLVCITINAHNTASILFCGAALSQQGGSYSDMPTGCRSASSRSPCCLALLDLDVHAVNNESCIAK